MGDPLWCHILHKNLRADSKVATYIGDPEYYFSGHPSSDEPTILVYTSSRRIVLCLCVQNYLNKTKLSSN